MNVFVINTGSSSLKYQLIDMNKKTVLAKGRCERIGIDGEFSCSTIDGRKFSCSINLSDYGIACKIALYSLTVGDCAVIKSTGEIDAVGHRIVNGGENSYRPCLSQTRS